MQQVQWQAIYLHGKGGNAREAEHYRALLPGWRVTGFDYRAQTPWEAREEFLSYFEAARREGTKLLLVANSIGAFFAMQALDETQVDRALFISPVVDMEQLIEAMMAGARRHRTGTAAAGRDQNGIWRDPVLAVSAGCATAPDSVAGAHGDFVRQRGRPHAPRNDGSLCPAHRCGPHRDGGR